MRKGWRQNGKEGGVGEANRGRGPAELGGPPCASRLTSDFVGKQRRQGSTTLHHPTLGTGSPSSPRPVGLSQCLRNVFQEGVSKRAGSHSLLSSAQETRRSFMFLSGCGEKKKNQKMSNMSRHEKYAKLKTQGLRIKSERHRARPTHSFTQEATTCG